MGSLHETAYPPFHVTLSQLREYDRNGGARQRMLDRIRQHVGIKAVTVEGKAVVRD